MTFLLACLLTFPGCSADLAQSVAPWTTVASVDVKVDSSTLLIGHVAQVSLTAIDTAGNSMTVPEVFWTSITPDIATVSPSGAVTALQSGEAVIEGSAVGSKGRVEFTVVSSPDLAAATFDDGTLGPFVYPWKTELDFPADPTGSGHGRVARFHYQGGFSDDNRAMEFTYARKWAQPMYFKGEFYIPVSDLGADFLLRKLVYWQSHNDYGKYTKNGGLASGRTVVHLRGTELFVDATYDPAASTGKSSDDVRTVASLATNLEGNRWYTLEVYQKMESALGRADGTLQVWLDGKLVFSNNTMTWSDPAWVGDMSNGVPFTASDIYFEHFLVGQQEQNNKGTFDEYRYWDNVEFSSRRIGR
jgi:hypothetical protein